MKKAIIFDLDETLRKIEQLDNQDVVVLLRPGIKELLKKLSEVKKDNIDILIWTSAKTSTINPNFIRHLPQEYQNIFNIIIGRENYPKIKPDSKEAAIYGLDTSNKAITTLDYDQILFFDDNKLEGTYLEELYDDKNQSSFKSPSKDVTYANLPYFPKNPSMLYAFKEIGKLDSELQKSIDAYFEILLNDPGCNIMTQIIDEFLAKEKQIGLKCILSEQLKEYTKNCSSTFFKLYSLIREKGFMNKFSLYQQQYISGEYKKEYKDNQDMDILY